jgi:type II secretory pathway pseudopilin PulG
LKVFFFALVAVAAVVVIWWAAGTLQESNQEEQLKITKEAILRATVQCYSLEGRYPPSLEYLEDNYGLTLDRTKYIYYYQSIGENIMPDVKLFLLEV